MFRELIILLEEFWWLGLISVALFILTLLLLPVVIVRLPSDYFAGPKPDGFISRQIPPVRILLLVLKNLTGLTMILMGILMLFLPGQGVLTILAGLSVMNFPGKRNLEIRLASNGNVMRGLNWIRKKGHKENFAKPVYTNGSPE